MECQPFGNLYFTIFTGYASNSAIPDRQDSADKMVPNGPDCVRFIECGPVSGSESCWSGESLVTQDTARDPAYVSNF